MAKGHSYTIVFGLCSCFNRGCMLLPLRCFALCGEVHKYSNLEYQAVKDLLELLTKKCLI